MTPVETVLTKLPDHKPAGTDKWQARCPAHEDRRASLSIGEGEGGRALLHCHAGCATEKVVGMLGLTMRDLMPLNGNGHRAAQWGKIVATYPYTDENGALLFEVVRFDPKDFRQRRPDGADDWTWKLGDVQRVLYRLPELLSAGEDTFVFIVEGEKDVDNLRAAGLVVTCNSGGAGKMGYTDTTPLHGRHVVIVPDADQPGRAHAQDVAARLHSKAASVRVIELPGDGKDVTDWLAAGGDGEELVRLAEAAPLWTPGQPAACVAEVPAPPAQPVLRHTPVLVHLCDVQAKSVQWLWPGRIALGKLSLFAGDPGLGKSFLTLDMASRVSTGAGWPDKPSERFTPGGVVLISAEDDIADTIRPRLDAAGANVKKIVALQTVRHADPATGAVISLPFTLSDILALEQAIQQTPGCRLVVIDPVSAYLDGTDSHKNADVRALLAPLSELANRYEVAVVVVTHLNKGGTGGSAMYRATGSLAFVAAARSAWAIARDRNDPTGKRRLFLPVKNNIGLDETGLAFALVPAGIGQPCVVWEAQPVTDTADEALAPPDTRPGPDADEKERAAEWLRAALANGPRLAKELDEEARESEGISQTTLKRARKTIGAVAYRTVIPGPWWIKLDPCPKGANLTPLPSPLEPGPLGPLAENKHFTIRGDSKGAKLFETGYPPPNDAPMTPSAIWSDGSPITVPSDVPTEPDWGAA